MTLWLRRLEVENFAGIESAEIEFASGLNICYGPNELGKSTLVRSIRAAILLQHTSKAADEFADWHADAPAAVTLVFETEPQRIWRIRKSFGEGRDGYSYLEFSRDGQTFTQEAKGREVDGRLQELLQWGIEGPGGTGRRRRGVPESFITTALLGEQAEVTAILVRTLDDDPDDSGKRRLTEALQAMAEDPVFRGVFAATQAKVDEAYTATGRHKSGRGSPWVQLRDQLQAAHERQAEINVLHQESESARIRIEGLHQDLLEAQSQAADVDRQKHQVIADLDKLRARAATQLKLEEATGELKRVRALKVAVQETRAEIDEKQAERDNLATGQKVLDQQVTDIQTTLEDTQARVTELESGTWEQQRRIREQDIQKDILTINAKETERKTRMGLAERIQEKSERAEALETEIEEAEANHTEAQKILTDAREWITNNERKLNHLNLQLTAIRFLDTKETLVKLQAAEDAADLYREEGEDLCKQALSIFEEIESLNVPTPEAVALLRDLETELRVAEERLQVGLTANVIPIEDADVEITLDGDDPHTHRISSAGQTFEAKRELRVNIPEFGSFIVRGGKLGHTEAAAFARSRWETESSEILKATDCSTVAELESLRQRAELRKTEAQDLERRAQAALIRAEAGTLDPARGQAATDNLARLEESLINLVPDNASLDELLESFSGDDQLDEAEVEEEMQDLQTSVSERRSLASQLDTEVSHDGGRLEGRLKELRIVEQERVGLVGNFEGDWKTAPKEISKEMARAQKQRSEAEQQLKAVQDEAAAEVDQARDRLTATRATLAEAQQALSKVTVEMSEITRTIAQLEGELGVQSEVAAAEDEDTARAAVNQYATELDALSVPDEEVDEEDLNDAELSSSRAAAEVRRLQLDVRQAEGALSQTGGQYIEEQAEQAREAVEAASAKEREVDRDYSAWSLLRDMLEEAESEDSVHLGNALVEPVSKRLSALTSGRLRIPRKPVIEST